MEKTKINKKGPGLTHFLYKDYSDKGWLGKGRVERFKKNENKLDNSAQTFYGDLKLEPIENLCLITRIKSEN